MAVEDDKDMNDLEKSKLRVAICSNVSVADLNAMPLNDYERLADAAREMLNEISDSVRPVDFYTLDGNEFRLLISPRQMNALQFIHLMTVLTAPDLDRRLHSVCALMLMPTDKAYQYPDYNVAKVEELVLEHMHIKDVFAIVGEAIGLSATSPESILPSLVLTEIQAWTRVKRWRRSLARVIMSILFLDSRKSGGRNHGSIELPNDVAGVCGERRSGCHLCNLSPTCATSEMMTRGSGSGSIICEAKAG